MTTLTIALISGGASPERQVSQDSGNQVFDALDKEKFRILRYDPKSDIAKLVADAPEIDMALIILHGPLGEDGTIQGMLDLLDIPYQGSGVLGSALSMNKLAAKETYEKIGFLVPPYLILKKGESIKPDRYIKQLGLPLVVKPVVGGSSIGMTLVKSRKNLMPAIEKAFQQDRSVMMESYIDGTELTCGVVGNDTLETYPVVEIIPGEDYEFFDYEAKYKPGATQEICPARIEDTVAEQVKTISKAAHKALYCRGYSRTDMIYSNRKLYVIETNTIPGMTRTSLLPQSAKAAGIGFDKLLERLIYLGLEEHTNKCHIQDVRRLQRIQKAMATLEKN